MFTLYTHELMKKFSQETSFDEEKYYDDIFQNWVDEELNITLNDACDLKDSTNLTGADAKEMIREYRKDGGKLNAASYIFRKLDALQLEEDEMMRLWEKQEPIHLNSEFI